MRKTGLYTILIGGVLMSTAAWAQQTQPGATPDAVAPQAAPADDPNEVICHPGEITVGSRFPGPRTCHTRREWQQIQQDSQRALEHQQMQRAYNPPGG